MIKKLLRLPVWLVFLCCCTNNKEGNNGDSRIMMRADTINSVRLSDTLVIYESVCRGCAYEQSTHFEVSDSLGIIKLEQVVTTDSNPSNMDGGSISKDLVLVPVKTGITKVKMYKFISQPPSAEDSARFTEYTVEVHNP